LYVHNVFGFLISYYWHYAKEPVANGCSDAKSVLKEVCCGELFEVPRKDGVDHGGNFKQRNGKIELSKHCLSQCSQVGMGFNLVGIESIWTFGGRRKAWSGMLMSGFLWFFSKNICDLVFQAKLFLLKIDKSVLNLNVLPKVMLP
jgi:hypothetical protein